MKQKYLLIIILLLANKILAQPGTLDQTFGEQGKLLSTTSMGLPWPANSVIIKRDGNIIVGSGEGTSFLLKQFLNNGTPDSSFGNAGEARTTFKNYYGAYTTAVSVTEDNKIIATGVGLGGGGTRIGDILLAKYLENGKIDSSFGINGALAINLNLIEVINCIKITNEGKMLVAGYCAAGDEEKENSFLVQFNSDGSVDTNFGDSGKVITDVGAPYQSYFNSIAIAPDGSIIAAGNAKYIPNSQQNQILLARYDVNGKLQTDFGTQGLVFTNVGSDADYAYAVALQNDGKIVAAGEANYKILDSSAMAVLRYNSDGSLDKTFNKTGVVSVFFGSDNALARSLIIQPNGNYILGGHKAVDYSSPPNYAATDFALAAVTRDGKLDSSFGTNGIVTTDFAEGQDACYALALQADGKILAGGGVVDTTFEKTYIAIARYNGFESRRQILIAKIRRWLQHYNGIAWDNIPGIKSYAVQRSSNGVGWTTVYRSPLTANSRQSTPVPLQAGANGQQSTVNGQQLAANRYIDPSPLNGTNYYRLQTTSIDGAVAYSNVIAISNENSSISLSPNPAKNVLRIEGLSSTQQTKIMVVDLAGNVALSVQPSALSGAYNLNIATLKPGNYMLRIESNGAVVTKQFVKE